RGPGLRGLRRARGPADRAPGSGEPQRRGRPDPAPPLRGDPPRPGLRRGPRRRPAGPGQARRGIEGRMPVTADLIREALADCDGSMRWQGPIDLRDARPASVVVPIVFSPEPSVVAVLRASHLADHAGEVGFPGVKPDPGD